MKYFTQNIQIGSVLLLVLLVVIIMNFYAQNSLMYGIYVAPADFCADADLSSLIMYLGPHGHLYLLATRDNDVLINSPSKYNISWTWLNVNNWPLIIRSDNCMQGTLTMEEKINGLPSKLDITVYSTGKLVLSSGDTCYAVFYKDAYATEST